MIIFSEIRAVIRTRQHQINTANIQQMHWPERRFLDSKRSNCGTLCSHLSNSCALLRCIAV